MKPAPAQLALRARTALECYPVAGAWSPDGSQLIVGGGEGAVFLVARADGAARRLGEHPGGLLGVEWPRGAMRFATSGQDGLLRLWDARSLEARVLHRGPGWLGPLACVASGKWLAAAAGREVLIFEQGGALHARSAAHPGVVAALAWRPRGVELAAAHNGGVTLHTPGAELRSRHYPWAGACLSASWSPDGRVLASGTQDGAVHFWRLPGGADSQMSGYGARVTLTEFSHNGRWLATSASEQLVLWDFSGRGPEGREALTLRGHSARILALAWRPGAAVLATGSRDWRLLLWRAAGGPDPEDAHLLGGEVVLLRWSHDGRWLAAADQDGVLSLFELVG